MQVGGQRTRSRKIIDLQQSRIHRVRKSDSGRRAAASPAPVVTASCYVAGPAGAGTAVTPLPLPDLPFFSTATVGLLALGAAAAGFVTGLAGFGTALVALAFWLHVVDARLAGPLVAVCAVASQVTSAGVIWRGMRWPRLWPMLAGGIAGLPLGIALLESVDTATLKGVVGMVLVGYALYNLLRGHLRVPRWGGRGADAAVGVTGGVLGGAAGLAGVLPTLWCAMRGWPPDEQRGAYQPYTLAVLALAIPGHAVGGALDARVAVASAITVPVAVVAGWAGVASYGRLDPRQFRLVVLWLLLGSGVLLLPGLAGR